MTASNGRILLVDDRSEELEKLEGAVRARLGADVDIATWRPVEDEPEKKFAELISDRPDLIVTDYDLTTSVKGLFGVSLVAWAQKQFIPAADVSRRPNPALPREPNLFEMRLPAAHNAAADEVFRAFNGFRAIEQKLQENPSLVEGGASLATVLAQCLGDSSLEVELSPYMTRLGAANSGLLGLRDLGGDDGPSLERKQQLLVYVLGHVLLNAILKYPGPVLHLRSLCAYFATTHAEGDRLAKLFAGAGYDGPFSIPGQHFWRSKVDDMLEAVADSESDDLGRYNRAGAETLSGASLADHGCDRCEGTRGGFWCPFQDRPVCTRGDCSVPSSSWIPNGATACRVERTFYDEWAPLMGL